jgi:hypothetical protein
LPSCPATPLITTPYEPFPEYITQPSSPTDHQLLSILRREVTNAVPSSNEAKANDAILDSNTVYDNVASFFMILTELCNVYVPVMQKKKVTGKLYAMLHIY